jgi:hypothetical protein
MKKIGLFIVCFLTTFLKMNGQNVVCYDFKTKNPPKICRAILGQNVVYRIENISKFLYDVKIDSKQTEYTSETPNIFTQVFKIETKENSNVNKEANKIVDQQPNTDKINSIKNKSILESELFLNDKKLEVYNKKLIDLNLLPDSIKSKKTKVDKLNAEINNLSSAIEKQKKTIEEFKAIITDEYIKAMQELYLKALNLHKSFELLEEVKMFKNKIVAISVIDGLTYAETKEKVNELTIKYPFCNNTENLIPIFNQSYREFKSYYELYIENSAVKLKFNNDVDKIKANISYLLTEIESIKNIVDKYDYNELFQNTNSLLNELNNSNNFFICSDPIQANKDIITFDIKISPKKNINSLSQLENRSFTSTIPIYGGIKIDFSTGLFITTGLHNRKYFITKMPNDTSTSILSESKNNNLIQPSLGALMHISPRWTNDYFKPSISFGFGLNSTDITKSNIFLGLSAILGSQERFIISSGVSFSQVDYLKGEYPLDNPIKTSIINKELTEKSFRAGWFISFTYNLSNEKKE